MDTIQRPDTQRAEDAQNGATSEAVTPPYLTANDLRRLAEAADGSRGDTLELVVDDPRKPKLRKLDDQSSAPPTAILIKTAKKAAKRKLPKDVGLTLPSGRTISLDPKDYDAVLWGEAAADKFLVPYYVRFYGEDEMATLRAAIANDEVIALAHIYPTIYSGIRDEALREAIETRGIRDELWVLTMLEGPGFDAGFVPISFWLAFR